MCLLIFSDIRIPCIPYISIANSAASRIVYTYNVDATVILVHSSSATKIVFIVQVWINKRLYIDVSFGEKHPLSSFAMLGPTFLEPNLMSRVTLIPSNPGYALA
jgi:hypothetical protein